MLAESDVETTVKDVEKFLTENAEIKGIDRKGKRKLAYSIDKKTHGDYTIFSFDGEGEVVIKLEKRLRLNEKVIRSMTVLREERNNSKEKSKE